MKNVAVRPGDSIATLAAANAVTFREILEANNLTPFENLPKSLLIPELKETAQSVVDGAVSGLDIKIIDWLYNS